MHIADFLPGRHLPKTPNNVAFARPWPTTRRGFKLWLIALILAIKGVGLIGGFATDTTEMTVRLAINALPDVLHAHLYLSPFVTGCLIMAACALAVFFSYCHHGRDRYGYNLMAAISCCWIGVYLVAPLSGAPISTIQGALSYALVWLFIVYSASDPDKSDVGVPADQCRPLGKRVRSRLRRRK